jgi:hypothetical protein
MADSPAEIAEIRWISPVRRMPFCRKRLLLIAAGSLVVMTLCWLYSRRNHSGSMAPTDPVALVHASVLSIHLPVPRESIDASEDAIEAGRCWVVKALVKQPVGGTVPLEGSVLNLLVHSPSLALGVSRVGQEFDVRLVPVSGPSDFLASDRRPLDASLLPETRHRSFSILTGPSRPALNQ